MTENRPVCRKNSKLPAWAQRGLRRIDLVVRAAGSDSEWELPSVFLKPNEDLWEGVLAQREEAIRDLTCTMKDPVVYLREWPYEYTRVQAVASLLIEDLDTDRL